MTEEDPDHVDLGTPVVGDQELSAISDVFETGWVLNGPTVRDFEDEFATYVDAEHAVSVVNCTAGMHMALDAVGLPDDATVLLPGQSFIADGIAVRQNGFDPLFVDVDPETVNVTPEAVEAHAEEADALLLVHYGGYPCEMDAIMDIADRHDIAVIEDAAHALGAEYKGKRIGTHGDATVFSFGPLKMITTGMGGMVTTGRDDVADELRTLRSYGMDTDAWDRQENAKPWQYAIPRLGHNFRLSDVAAGMGLAQLERIEEFIDHRRSMAAHYEGGLEQVDGIHTSPIVENGRHPYLYYVIQVGEEYPIHRDELAASLMDSDIGISVHWDPPLHEHKLFDRQFDTPDLPVSEALAERLLTLPMHPELRPEDVQRVTDVIASEGR